MNKKNGSDRQPSKKSSAKKIKRQVSGLEIKAADDEQETIADQVAQKYQTPSGSLYREPPSVSNSLETESAHYKQRILQSHPNPEQVHLPLSQTNSVKEQSGLGNILNKRFELLEEIGSGGMGVVYKALDMRDVEAGNSLFIAIKILKDECKDEPIILKALHSEARKTRKLAHPNIVTVYDFDRDADGDMVYMTMEFLDGVTLRKLIEAHPNGLEPTLAITIIEQLGQALTYAHSHQVIHSDLKPGNIIIDKNNHVKVLDFGFARLANYTRVSEFDAGVLGGMTPIYASLEMLNRLGPDQSDDVYSLACVAYELFTGEHAFGRRNAVQALQTSYKPKRIKSLNQRQWRALNQALELKRENRTKTVSELVSGLHGASNKILHFTVVSLLLVLLLYVLNLGLLPKMTTLFETLFTQNSLPPKLSDDAQQINIRTDKKIYRINDPFKINFSVTKPAYIRMIVVNSRGEIETIFPNELQKDIYCLPGTDYHIPPLDSDHILQVEGPTGKDRIIAVASNKPFSNEVMTLKANGNLLAEDEPEKFTVVVQGYIIE